MTSSSRDNIIQRMFNFSAKELEQAILERVLIDAPPLDEIIYKLVELLGINKVEAVGLLGISSAQEISKATITVDVLDRPTRRLKCLLVSPKSLEKEAPASGSRNPKECSRVLVRLTCCKLGLVWTGSNKS
jgi:hypothetical protein